MTKKTANLLAVKIFLVFIFIKEEIIFTRIVRPDIFDTFIGFTFIFNFLKVFNNL